LLGFKFGGEALKKELAKFKRLYRAGISK